MNGKLINFPILSPELDLHLDKAGIYSAIPPERSEAEYDSIASLYDLVIGNSVYNRIVWGNWADRYVQSARHALASANADDWILDCGCGSLCFTAKAYRDAPLDRMILLDRSIGMLGRAQKRLPQSHFIQADALAMPFKAQTFGTSMAWGMLHIFGSASPLLKELYRVTKPGGKVFMSTLVLSKRGIGNRLLHTLNAKGEIASPESAETIRHAFGEHFEIIRTELVGSMLLLEGRVA